MDEESELDIERQPLLPTALHDPIDAFLNSNEETKLTIASEATILTPGTQETSVANNVLATSLSSTAFVETLLQSEPPSLLGTLPIPSVQ